MRLKPAVRQSPGPAASAYSNVWLQCCQAKLLPSGAARRSPSIQIPDGHALHERISDMCSVPSGVTTQPGVPRFSTATDRSASGTGRSPSPGPASAPGPVSAGSPASTTASARSPARAVTAAASSAGPAPATISTGRSPAPRTSASGPNASARSRVAGTHSRAVPEPASSRAASALAYPGPAAASTSAVNGFTSGPPTAILTSGRLESASIPPYLDPSAWLHVAVTPAAASATSSSLSVSRRSFGSKGQTTSATPIAWVSPLRPPVRTRAVEPTPNH